MRQPHATRIRKSYQKEGVIRIRLLSHIPPSIPRSPRSLWLGETVLELEKPIQEHRETAALAASPWARRSPEKAADMASEEEDVSGEPCQNPTTTRVLFLSQMSTGMAGLRF
jgi:hypothetical protein